ncbi:hypothetical protein [Burkholderia sp. Tr-20390]|uniref:hypothetical protein n=1 Tax=Burkholderia sp. Tr-20390 TaxID=2703904 RepID=UPI00197D089B|nr:hypothetical protein [Burkholderia sp. Tr-20390]MBN3730128.1 hypothetical protein [Burkholderia sp. Tr-20390]
MTAFDADRDVHRSGYLDCRNFVPISIPEAMNEWVVPRGVTASRVSLDARTGRTVHGIPAGRRGRPANPCIVQRWPGGIRQG